MVEGQAEDRAMAEALDSSTGGDSSNRPALSDYAGSDTDAPRFSLGSLLAGMAWLCVLLALAKVVAEVAVLLTTLSLPALGRASWLRSEYQRRGKPVTLAMKCWFFLSSVGIISAAIVVGFGASCFVIAVATGTILALLETFASDMLAALATLLALPVFGAALVTAIWTGVTFETLLRPRFLRAKNVAASRIDMHGYNPSTSAIE
jgi:hypothetical protein